MSEIEKRLTAFDFWDEEVKAFVGMLPEVSGIMTQARTEETLVLALESAAQSYVKICRERGISEEDIFKHVEPKPKFERMNICVILWRENGER